jgi:ribosomal protein S18 acetylase RimI-like enzyme
MTLDHALRPAVAADVAAVQALFRQHLRELGCAPDPGLDADMDPFPGPYARRPNIFLVVEQSGCGVIGMAGLLAGEIRRVYVAPAFRRQGLARALILELLRRARAVSLAQVTAHIQHENVPSRRLFQGCGFAPTDQAPSSPKAHGCSVFVRDLCTAPAPSALPPTRGSRASD